jgi:purine nucleosidase
MMMTFEFSKMLRRLLPLSMVGLFAALPASGQRKRYVVIDQDVSGPGDSNCRAIQVFLQSPNVDVLGITVVTGNAWRDEEVLHALRLLELMGRTDIPVISGANEPLIRTQEWTRHWEHMYGKVFWQGAWTNEPKGPNLNLPEGNPNTKPLDETAPHFLIRMVHKYPHQVTIYAAGPMTDIAEAIIEDPQFADLAKELVAMGGSISPHTTDKNFLDSPRQEFNFWFDPEAASIVLHAPWHKITDTTVDVSVQAHLTNEMLDELGRSHSAAARYIAKYAFRPKPGTPPASAYMWDELAAAAWLDPSMITWGRSMYMDVDLGKGADYGNTLTWSADDKPDIELPIAYVQLGVDWPKFRKMFMDLMMAPTPGAKDPQMLNQN